VAVVAAEQTEERSDWFQGTADVVRRAVIPDGTVI
jgi:hypothetical protein